MSRVSTEHGAAPICCDSDEAFEGSCLSSKSARELSSWSLVPGWLLQVESFCRCNSEFLSDPWRNLVSSCLEAGS